MSAPAPEQMGGDNLAFAEALYEQFLADPESVDPTWRATFEALGGAPTAIRPSFQPRSIFAGVAPANGHTNGHANGNGNGAAVAGDKAAAVRQERIDQLVNAYRALGHLAAQLDPLGTPRAPVPELELAFHGLTEADLDLPVRSRTVRTDGLKTARDLIEHLRATYCRSIGAQLAHIDSSTVRHWLQERMESTQNRLDLSTTERVKILTRLTDAEIFEQFIQKKFLGAKSFSLEGGESLIPMLDLVVERAAHHGVQDIVIGMAHRGRLNVLANILRKNPRQIFREFEDKDAERSMGRGDVKYHLGRRCQHVTATGAKVDLTLCFNPSHLEFVDPVVLGRVRARQDARPAADRGKCMGVIIHGDAAFAGQGIVQEVLNMSSLEGYKTGGAIHIIVNNQIGFTTPTRSARSTRYATDVARMLEAPILHVNGEDPEAVAQVALVALDFRARFGEDVIIDLYCYRRHGHNEADEPAYTQPLMYKQIRGRKTVRESYVERLLGSGLTQEDADRISDERRRTLEAELSVARGATSVYEPSPTQTGNWERLVGGPADPHMHVQTAVTRANLQKILESLSRVPSGFKVHPKLEKIIAGRAEAGRGERPLDWAAAEAAAFGSLVVEGHPVRLSGQDVGRGTFSHRHAVLHDAEDGKQWVGLQNLADGQARFAAYDSPLSEAGVLGFDYGYSLEDAAGLVCWEAQFGDFVNGAQVIIDQFISSAEDKWNLLSGIVLLLPHGFEGQGPEHSSGRVERFLQLAAEDNLFVTNPSTPANLFHALRRQVKGALRKPLVVMTPKSLLRHPQCVSPLEDLTKGGFRTVIGDDEVKDAKRVLLVSGRLYYDLVEARAARQRKDVAGASAASETAIVRLEQLYPLDEASLTQALAPHPAAPVVWVQEDPRNMGGWYYLRARHGETLLGRPFSCVSRAESASPATGSPGAHKREQELLMKQAFGEM